LRGGGKVRPLAEKGGGKKPSTVWSPDNIPAGWGGFGGVGGLGWLGGGGRTSAAGQDLASKKAPRKHAPKRKESPGHKNRKASGGALNWGGISVKS